MKIKSVGQIASGQDGAIWGNHLFRFDSTGFCNVYNLSTLEKEASFSLDDLNLWQPHSNSVSFGCEYFDADDEFPLLYTNVYNTYANEKNRHEGVCCVYRLTRQNNAYRGQLMQTITIGFTSDDNLWCSSGKNDARPYGNFIIDREAKLYYGFVMRDNAHSTRYFAFRLPKLEDGAQVTLNSKDILFHFDCPYHHYVQGTCTHAGKIYSLEGFTASQDNPPALRIIDPSQCKQVSCTPFSKLGLFIEPEFIDFRDDTCFYADIDGNLYIIDTDDELS